MRGEKVISNLWGSYRVASEKTGFNVSPLVSLRDDLCVFVRNFLLITDLLITGYFFSECFDELGDAGTIDI